MSFLNSVPQTTSRLTPLQEENARALFGVDSGWRPSSARPRFPLATSRELRAELERELTPLADRLPPGDWVSLSKRPISSVMKCEGLRIAEQEEPFAYRVPILRGEVAHRAIGATITNPEVPPIALVEDALRVLRAEKQDVDAFVESLSPVDMADLVLGANNEVCTFLDSCPPLAGAVMPRVEDTVRLGLCGRRFNLSATHDLTTGRPSRVNDEMEAGKAIVELKTGRERIPEHRADLHFYALVETIVRGAPPFRVSLLYLDHGQPWAEDVTIDVLQSGIRRTVEAASKLVDMHLRVREPTLSPESHCTFCPAKSSCQEGQRWLARNNRDHAYSGSSV